MGQDKIVRLAGPRRKGIWRLLFSRLLIIGILMAVQLSWMLSALVWFQEHLRHFALCQGLFTIGMVLYLFNSRMDPTAKLTWMALIAVFPLPGSLFLAYTHLEIGHRAVKARVEGLIAQTKDAIPQDETVFRALSEDGSGTDDLCRYLNRSGCFPAYGGTEVRYFPSGEAKFDAMVEELEKAERSIYLEYFIIEEGVFWGRILEILSRKAAAGVDVRVLYDGMCEISLLPHDYPKRLETLGIRARAFSPLTPFLTTSYNYRDHRKILVIDGETAFTGGVNLADEYINQKERFGHWKDTAVMLRGPAARTFTLLFLQMWGIGERDPVFLPVEHGPAPIAGASGYVIPYGDCPLDGERVGESVYIDILYRADRYVHIMTPYLILDGELEAALRYAGERGIDVELILPGIPDKKSAYALAKSHYASLIEAGVKIWEYDPGFVHAKVCVSDDRKAVVGTINFDYRSLYHHFECAAYLYEVPCITEIEADFQETLKECRPVTPETIRAEKLSYKLMGHALKLLAPLM